VLHLAGVNIIDSRGSATVAEVIGMAEKSEVDLRLAGDEQT